MLTWNVDRTGRSAAKPAVTPVALPDFTQEAEAKKKAAEEEEKRKSEETKESSADALSEKLNGWFSTLVDKVCSPSDKQLSAHLQYAVLLQQFVLLDTRTRQWQ